MPHRLLVATRSAGKRRELEPLLAAAGYAMDTLDQAGLAESPDEEVVEAFPTFRENALAKARYFHERSGGRAVLAEDSGLCVTALGGGPGVRSKRWGAEAGLTGAALDAANNARLLEALAGAEDRGAWYHCAAAIVWAGGEMVFEGESHGWILEAPCGTAGFGYDPYFWSTELDACFGDVSREEKGRVSHRARAVGAVLRLFGDARDRNPLVPG